MLFEYEFTIKTDKQFDKCFDEIKRLKQKFICLTDKKDNQDPFETALKIRKVFPFIKFSLNYSLSNNYARSKQEVLTKFESFLNKIINFKIDQLLLVSGNPKRKIDSLAALEFIKTNLQLKEIFFDGSKTKLAVAFNPFLDDKEQESRLRLKLATGLVKKVYFQLGDNIDRLKKGIKFVRDWDSNLEICLSVLIITKAKLWSLKNRPWHGVIFSNKFLNSLEFANSQNSLILDIAKIDNCSVLFT